MKQAAGLIRSMDAWSHGACAKITGHGTGSTNTLTYPEINLRKAQLMRFVTRAPRSVFVVIVAALVVWATTLSPRLPVLRVADDAVVLAQAGAQPAADAGRPLKVLFLGQDQTTHSAAGLYQAIGAPLARHGIQLTAVLAGARSPPTASSTTTRSSSTAITRRSHLIRRRSSPSSWKAARASSRCIRRRKCSRVRRATHR